MADSNIILAVFCGCGFHFCCLNIQVWNCWTMYRHMCLNLNLNELPIFSKEVISFYLLTSRISVIQVAPNPYLNSLNLVLKNLYHLVIMKWWLFHFIPLFSLISEPPSSHRLSKRLTCYTERKNDSKRIFSINRQTPLYLHSSLLFPKFYECMTDK